MKRLLCRATSTFIVPFLMMVLNGCGTAERDLPEPVATTPATLPDTTPVTPPALRAALRDAWGLRDQLEGARGWEKLAFSDDNWGPTEYAPHLWRRLNALLLDLDVRSRGGMAFDKQNLLEVVNSQVDGLQNLADGSYRAEAPFLIREIGQASTDFHQASNQARSSFHTASPEVDEIGKYLRYCCRLTYRAVDYVGWHGQMIFREEGDDVASELDSLLQGLTALQTTVDSLDGQRLDPSLGHVERLREQWRQLEKSRTIVEGILEREVSSAAEKYANDPECRLRAERLLATPLLSSKQRETVLVAIENAAMGGSDRIANQPLTDWPLPSAKLSKTDLSRLVRQFELQQRLFQLVDRELGGEARSMVQKLDLITRSSTENEAWQLLRDAGAWLGEAYSALPARIQQCATQDSSRAERLLRLVDARDAQRIADLLGSARRMFPKLRVVPPPTARRLELAQANPTGNVHLAVKQWRPLMLKVELSDESVTTVAVQISYQQDAMQIRRQGIEQVVAPGVLTGNIPLRPDRTLLYEVSALQTQASQSAGQQVTFMVQAGELNASLEVRFLLPKPNSIELLAQRVAPLQPASRITTNGVRLRPFPNRSTQFQFSLANLSDEDKDVNVAFYATERPSNASFGRGRLLDNAGGNLPGIRLESRVLAAAKSVLLPADGKPRQIKFDVPENKEAPPEGPTATPKEAQGATKSEGPANGPEVTDGIACVIRNNHDPDDKWGKWIELKPLVPSEYLLATSQYDRNAGRITVHLEPRDVDRDGRPDPGKVLPDNLEGESAVKVSWEKRGDITAEANGSFFGQIDSGRSAVNLWAMVPARDDEYSVTIPLTVDRYPRAFVHRLEVNRDNQGVDLRPDRRFIRIDSLSMGNLVYLTSPNVPAPGLREGQRLAYLEDSGFAAFPASLDGASLNVQFQVDAPIDAFSQDKQEDYVQIGWLKTSPTRFYADRQVSIRWAAAEADGLVTLATQVGDYSHKLETRGKEGRFVITAGGRVRGDDYLPHQVEVVLDGQPPQPSYFRVRRNRVEQGQPIQVDLEVQDLSGLAQVRMGLTSGRADEVPKEAELHTTTGNTLSVSIKTDELAPGSYWIQGQLVDRVGHQRNTGDPGFDPPMVEILARPKPTAQNGTKDSPEPYKATLRGYVTFGSLGYKPNGVTVRIKGTNRQTTTQNGGRFEFSDVPTQEQEYVLEASGFVSGYPKAGETKVQLKAAKDYESDTVVQIK